MRTFAEYFNEHVCSFQAVPKSKSILMKIIAGILWLANKLKITNIQDFMGNYATTLHATIYWPEKDPNVGDGSRFRHELTHVMEWKYRGSRYDLEYFFNKKKRAFYETICVQTNMILDKTKQTQSYIISLIPSFVAYGIPKEIVRKELNDRLTEVLENRPQVEAAVVADAHRAFTAMIS